jgi:thioesterase domain-containing protein/acyl carrier protein
VLPSYGLNIKDLEYAPETKPKLECADEDYYLGTFELIPYAARRPSSSVDIYVQSHPGKVADLPAGQYRYAGDTLTRVSDDLVLQKHVIAINQQVYRRASVGITVISRTQDHWLRYIDLGRTLQRLQMNDLNLGFMSSGYSSKSGNPLPSAKRIESTLSACGAQTGPSYFCVGGRVSEEQVLSEGMKEDAVHMKGPAEMIKDDLVNLLPDYMVPNRVVVLDSLPLTANGKIDVKTLQALDGIHADVADRPVVAPRTASEARIAEIWKKDLKLSSVSVQDDFFESGGNSLIAVGLINKINRACQSALPLQDLFEFATIEALARRVDRAHAGPSSRLVALQAKGSENPVYCWPGLGGYTMNLRLLARRLGADRPFYGVQAYGINDNETPYATIKEMAAKDIAEIKHVQPVGPYMLWGYSFGARVAFETAYQLERAGERIEHLFLIAPGSPTIRAKHSSSYGNEPAFRNSTFVTILFSVFTGSITGHALHECLKVAKDEESFASFISNRFENLDNELVKRVIRIVYQTYSFEYAFGELAERQLRAPITIFKARGDDYSFIESSSGYSVKAPTVIDLHADHYRMLKASDVGELARMIRYRLGAGTAARESSTGTRRLLIPQADMGH